MIWIIARALASAPPEGGPLMIRLPSRLSQPDTLELS